MAVKETPDGREFTISSVQYANAASNSTDAYVQINTTGLGFPDADFNVKTTAGAKLNVMYNPSTNVEAFSSFFQNPLPTSSIFRPYSHSGSISGVFHHASGPSIMVYHKFTQTQHGPSPS